MDRMGLAQTRTLPPCYINLTNPPAGSKSIGKCSAGRQLNRFREVPRLSASEALGEACRHASGALEFWSTMIRFTTKHGKPVIDALAKAYRSSKQNCETSAS